MKISLSRENDAVHFKLSNAQGNIVEVDGSPEVGGEGKGVRPTELLLMGAASCSAIDIISLLKKMKQPLEDIQVEVEGVKANDQIPPVFVEIHMHYVLTGNIKEKKAEKAIKMSVEKYCTVSKMLEKTAKFTTSFEIISK